ncbi:hypothetical protein YC2023_110397 [Brassica napus]
MRVSDFEGRGEIYKIGFIIPVYYYYRWLTFTHYVRAQVSDSIKTKACMKNCIINQCMQGSHKATPAKCYRPCKIMCDPKKDGQDIANPHAYHNPIERFCINFNWIFNTCKE